MSRPARGILPSLSAASGSCVELCALRPLAPSFLMTTCMDEAYAMSIKEAVIHALRLHLA